MPETWLSIPEAAHRLCVSQVQVRRLALAGRLNTLSGTPGPSGRRSVLIEAASVDAYTKTDRKRGRPPKRKGATYEPQPQHQQQPA